MNFGLPPTNILDAYEIWDSYFTPAFSNPGADGISKIANDIERSKNAIELGRINKLCYFAHVGLGTTTDAAVEQSLRTNPRLVTKPLETFPELLLAMIQLNANDVRGSLAAIDRWIKDGPMLGVYFPGGGPVSLSCSHPNFVPLVRRLNEVGAAIMQHTWFKTGGKERDGESTPSELVELAKKFPEQKFVCAHAGGEWERGIRAVRDQPNVLIETSGFDATAGFIEMAVRDLGAERIVFGSHLPSRSLGTELSKVIAADISEDDKQRILGKNFRQLLKDIGRLPSP